MLCGGYRDRDESELETYKFQFFEKVAYMSECTIEGLCTDGYS